MTDSRSGSKPWTLSWVHMVLALAVGAGMPLLWMGFAPPVKPVAVADAAGAGAGRAQAESALGGFGPASAVPAAEVAQGPTAAPPPAAPRGQAQAQAQEPVPQIARVREPNGDQSPDITDFINLGEVPTMAEVISRLHAAGMRGGLGAFNPPGTRPPLVGIAVSEDFELPPGYVRHHQVTDDGQRIEPILMFSPDHPLVVAAGQASGQASVRAQDRVVSPALVPPGLPIRHIVVPPPLEPGTESRK